MVDMKCNIFVITHLSAGEHWVMEKSSFTLIEIYLPPGFGFRATRSKPKVLLSKRQPLLFIALLGTGVQGGLSQKMQVQPTAMVSMTARWRQGPVRGGSGQRRRRTGTWLNTGTLTMLRSSCMVKGFTQPRHRHRASGRSAGMRLGSWLMLREGKREHRAEGWLW